MLDIFPYLRTGAMQIQHVQVGKSVRNEATQGGCGSFFHCDALHLKSTHVDERLDASVGQLAERHIREFQLCQR